MKTLSLALIITCFLIIVYLIIKIKEILNTEVKNKLAMESGDTLRLLLCHPEIMKKKRVVRMIKEELKSREVWESYCE